MKEYIKKSNNYIPKLFLKSLLLTLLVLIGSISYANAINPFEEINAISQDPYSAHSLYLGMQEKEYQEKFKEESWTKIKDNYDGNSRMILYQRHLDYGVCELLSIVMINGKVGFYEFSFLHYSKYVQLLTDMSQTALENISKVLGKAPKGTSDKENLIKTLIWEIGTEQQLSYIADISGVKNPKSPCIAIRIQRQGNPAYL